MDKRHPVAELMSGKSLQSRMIVDSLSMRNARISQDEVIRKDLVDKIIYHFVEHSSMDDVVTKRVDEGYNTVYEAELYVLTPTEMFNLMDEAFQRGANFQYDAMSRVLGEQIAKAEESKDATTTKTDSE